MIYTDLLQMAPLERTALQLATGRILDVGAGSGCHSLILQAAGKEVEAIDISPLSVEAMRKRGVKQVTQANLFNESFCGSYDTLLMLMNGSGIIGRLENLPAFFGEPARFLPEGQTTVTSRRQYSDGFQRPALPV